ncbi:uncharacterized protein LOC128877308 [Hylaeus volcanicus]|uniref:uncharacterized protein LOC128877308 n=1 Tax=Hylaeus volcanicus TaxID=313075 RepID=UPI0023B7BA8D|nr:uncharacterized protein LOC128877308 [Hylaeus volcanicus]XP_053980472.1 uncharacterized protein LOC128877308 [Hylaeus volcanicus]XP_053980473.1 uncharacterized protein LOC128877308 [Hylaeus volcanicus]
MEEWRAELTLGALYISSAIFSVTSLISLVTVWQHWTWNLDVCISIDCSCILYGINTFRTFTGGEVKFCHFGVYGLVPAILIGLCLGGYHAYRCCINRNFDGPVRVYDNPRRSLNDVPRTVVVRPKSRRPYRQWLAALFLAILMCCLSFAHAVITTGGYYKTCEQYRRRLIELLNSTGREAELIHDRLSCGAIFDFMDYLEPQLADWRRDKLVDTGIALQLAIIFTWLNVCAWILAFLLNFVMARKRICCCE